MSLRIVLVSLDKFRYASAGMQCCLARSRLETRAGSGSKLRLVLLRGVCVGVLLVYEAAYIIRVPSGIVLITGLSNTGVAVTAILQAALAI